MCNRQLGKDDSRMAPHGQHSAYISSRRHRKGDGAVADIKKLERVGEKRRVETNSH